ncbi:uncharacterized protein LOC122721799 [Manihot esculenta]|uniref:uncharacterized protein LOC122721799 n=1 Tax=Manihot esculenta TaxID=3983 RepID=UPI001CC3E8B2|nr:uncharacterized protein LOC122721799 [Manihot esculenta]
MDFKNSSYKSCVHNSKEMQRQVDELMEKGLVRESLSPCDVPMLLIPKKDSTWQMCVDCRAVNKITVKYKHPIFRLDEALDELYDARSLDEDIEHVILFLQVLVQESFFYERFVQNFSTIVAPLIEIIKKLGLSRERSIGIVLMQENKSIAYFDEKLNVAQVDAREEINSLFQREVEYALSRRHDGYLFEGKKLCVPRCSIRDLLVLESHCGSLMGHFGVHKTYDTLFEHFY